MTDRTDTNDTSTYYIAAFRERDGWYCHWTFTLTPRGAAELGVKLRASGILAFFTRKGKVTYLRKPYGYPQSQLKHKE